MHKATVARKDRDRRMFAVLCVILSCRVNSIQARNTDHAAKIVDLHYIVAKQEFDRLSALRWRIDFRPHWDHDMDA